VRIVRGRHRGGRDSACSARFNPVHVRPVTTGPVGAKSSIEDPAAEAQPAATPSPSQTAGTMGNGIRKAEVEKSDCRNLTPDISNGAASESEACYIDNLTCHFCNLLPDCALPAKQYISLAPSSHGQRVRNASFNNCRGSPLRRPAKRPPWGRRFVGRLRPSGFIEPGKTSISSTGFLPKASREGRPFPGNNLQFS